MHLSLDPESPVPLYHQIAEQLRYRIARGRLAAGQHLPPTRAAAALWSVNMHTVRRAYAVLVEAKLVVSAPGLGTRVVGGFDTALEKPAPSRALDLFLKRVAREAASRFGATRDQLADLLRQSGVPGPTNRPARVSVLECSRLQCEDHAQELEARWQVEAVPWPLNQPGEPPPGPLVGTYFHFEEIRRRWPTRAADLRFVAIRPQPEQSLDLERLKRTRPLYRLIVCEAEDALVGNLMAELVIAFPEAEWKIIPRVTADPAKLLRERGVEPVLIPTRLWVGLTPNERASPRAIRLRSSIDPADLALVGEIFGWRERTTIWGAA